MPKAQWTLPCKVAKLGKGIADGKSTARRPNTFSPGLTAEELAV
jgi:hypothetical protein